MNEHEIFTSLGFYLKKGFLDASLCEEICAQISAQASEAGSVKAADRGYTVDANVRRTRVANVPVDYAYMIRDRLDELTPAIEAHFTERLGPQEKPQFLLYEPGGHYAPHRDIPVEPVEPEARIKGRIVSIVIFLNDRAGPHPYSGGELVFYELSSDPQWKDYGLPLEAETGLLVAFRSETLHEVRSVTYGERYTIVTWFH
ncbi:MAG: 2OG-Fe(II) oxygenase [Blastocatellia bacterium]